MTRTVYRYRFEKGVSMRAAHELLLLSVIGAECLHGRSRVLMDASYRFSRCRRACVVDASTEVGRDICRLFTGYAALEFGDDAFTVERLDVAYAPEPAPVSL